MNFNAATQSINTVTVVKANQTMVSLMFHRTLKVGASSTISATASSGLAVSFSSTTPKRL